MEADRRNSEPVEASAESRERSPGRRAAFAFLGALLLSPLLVACKTGSTAPGSGVKTIGDMRRTNHHR